MINTDRAELIVALRLLAQISGGKLVTQAADMLESDAQPRQVTCKIYGHVVGACVECSTHIEAQQVVPAWTIAAERDRLRQQDALRNEHLTEIANLRDERDAEREANGLLHQDYAKLTAELAQERQHRNGHLPDCAGMDFENMRCGCGYLDGTAYRELTAERDALTERVKALEADAERYQLFSNLPLSDGQIGAALKAACLQDTPESRKDMERAIRAAHNIKES